MSFRFSATYPYSDISDIQNQDISKNFGDNSEPASSK